MNLQKLNTKLLTLNERELIGLLYSCPFGESSLSCELNHFRNVLNPDYYQVIDSFDKKKIPELLSNHKLCLINRVENEKKWI